MSDNELRLQEFGKRIIERRKQLSFTQEALAEKADVTTQFVSYAESGKLAMRPENLLKVSAALEVSADYLLTRATPFFIQITLRPSITWSIFYVLQCRPHRDFPRYFSVRSE